MFLEISKAFDKVWYQSILYKLKQNDISGNLLETLTDFLKDQSKELYWMDETQHGQMLKPEFLKALLKKSLLQKVNKAVTLLRKF